MEESPNKNVNKLQVFINLCKIHFYDLRKSNHSPAKYMKWRKKLREYSVKGFKHKFKATLMESAKKYLCSSSTYLYFA